MICRIYKQNTKQQRDRTERETRNQFDLVRGYVARYRYIATRLKVKLGFYINKKKKLQFHFPAVRVSALTFRIIEIDQNACNAE